jgi:hypothetical protein
MHQPMSKRRWLRRSVLLALLLLVAYGSYRLVRPDPNLKKVRRLQSEFASAQAKEWTPEQRREKFQEMRTAMEQLTPAQRDDLAAERQKRFEDELRRYAQLSPAEKIRHLDEQINRAERMRQQFAQRNANGSGQRAASQGPGAFGAGGPRQGGPGRNASPEERERRRKERLNNTSPEFRALLDNFRKDMENRRRQRGLVR